MENNNDEICYQEALKQKDLLIAFGRFIQYDEYIYDNCYYVELVDLFLQYLEKQLKYE